MKAKSETTRAGDGATPPRFAKNILLAVLAGMLIYAFLGAFLDYKEMKRVFSSFAPWQIILPFGLICAIYLIDTFRFRLLFKQFGIKLSKRDALYSNVIGYFFSCITPSSAGGQPFQIYHFTKLGIDSTVATNIVFSRLMVSTLSQLLVIIAFAYPGVHLIATMGGSGLILGLGLALTIGTSLLLFLVFTRPTLLGRLVLRLESSFIGRRIGKGVKDERWAEKFSAWSLGLGDSFSYLWAKRFGIVLVDLLLHVLDHGLWALGLYLPLRALSGLEIPFSTFFFAFNLCGLVSYFVPTPGASGSVEAAYTLVLGGLTGMPGASLSAVILWRFSTYYLHLVLGGIVYFFVRTERKVYEVAPDGTKKRLAPRA